MAVRRRPLSARVVSVLRAKAKNRKNITLGMLKKVYRRGQGAFLISGSRPRTSMASWSMGRVNSFLRGSRKHDTDLRRKKKKWARNLELLENILLLYMVILKVWVEK